ncbi:MAG: tetratricopeptide repeat protein [Myxococcota bacterium]
MWWVLAAGAAGWAADTTPPSASEDFRSYLDQARFFLRKEWYDDAREQLELAVATEDGRLDPEAWFLLAKVSYELGDLTGARRAADRALVHSRDQDQADQTHELLQFFDQKFGFVTVESSVDGVAATLDVTLDSTLFDPDLKLWLNRVVASLAQPVTLPYELGLPAAKYTINGVPVEVTAGSHQSIAPAFDGRPAALQVIELELGLGGSGYVGSTLANLNLAPTLDASLGAPFGPVTLGVTGAFAPQPYQTRDGAVATAFGAWSLGARIGVEVHARPMIVRPSITWRVASVPGLEVACADTGDVWACSRDNPVRELYVYTAAVAQAVGLEVATLWHDRASGRLGIGLKGGADVVVGSLPVTGRAVGPDGPLSFDVAGERGVVGGGWRLGATAVYGF